MFVIFRDSWYGDEGYFCSEARVIVRMSDYLDSCQQQVDTMNENVDYYRMSIG
jgi:hypothetical protein